MGRDLYEAFPSARTVFESADRVLGFALSELMFQGPEAELTDTLNAQPALLTHSTATLAALRELAARHHTPLSSPAFCAGHSLGEYSALVAAGALAFEDGVRLVRARGAAMQRAGQARPGAMAAILGLDDSALEIICAQAGGVQVANFNAPGQIVISGDKAGIERAVDAAKKQGAKRAIVLAVSIAAHSELMQSAVQEFRAAVMNTPLQPPLIPVVSNITARPLPDTDAIRAEMLGQLTSSVQWVQSVEWMRGQGVTEFLEIGPKDVLTGLNKRIARDAVSLALGTEQALAKYINPTEEHTA